MAKNYYEILGLKKNASADDIKKAYKTLAVKWHPDRWANGTEEEKKIAEEKFKEINEANSVLSDPEKRQKYDFEGSGRGSIFDEIRKQAGFGNPFGSPFGMWEEPIEKGPNVRASVNISFAEAYTGVNQKEVHFKRPVPCSHCHGHGTEDGLEHKCPHCDGSGWVVTRSGGGNMFFEQRVPCQFCHGTGKDNSVKECRHCGGTGSEMSDETVRIDVPAGIMTGMNTSVPGMGGVPLSKGGVPGDLVIVFNVVGGAPFYREGSDLYCPIDLTLLEAWDGCEKTVYLPDGVPVRIKIPKGSKEGTEIRVSGRGFSRRFEQDSFFGQPKTGNGDFVLKVKYKVPSKITKEQHKLLEKFYELGS